MLKLCLWTHHLCRFWWFEYCILCLVVKFCILSINNRKLQFFWNFSKHKKLVVPSLNRIKYINLPLLRTKKGPQISPWMSLPGWIDLFWIGFIGKDIWCCLLNWQPLQSSSGYLEVSWFVEVYLVFHFWPCVLSYRNEGDPIYYVISEVIVIRDIKECYQKM